MAAIDVEQRTRACADHELDLPELDLPELDRTLGATPSRLERYYESLEAFEAAIATGDRGLPHPRMNVAEVLLRAGWRDEADAVFADLRRQCPGGSWLYNAAGFAYAEVGELAAALPWLEEGIAMAFDDEDREGILHQLDDERARCRATLGPGDNELTARVAATSLVAALLGARLGRVDLGPGNRSASHSTYRHPGPGRRADGARLPSCMRHRAPTPALRVKVGSSWFGNLGSAIGSGRG
ncbi:MAG: hypothetical protein ACYCS7_14935 [Acidimicrobiales bacterium]